MSSSPKYCQASLDRQRQQELEEARRRQARLEAEERRRREAEERERRRREQAERERQQRFADGRLKVGQQVDDLLRNLSTLSHAINIADAERISSSGRDLKRRIAEAADLDGLVRLEREVTASVGELRAAIQRQELVDLNDRIIAIRGMLAELGAGDGLKFDPAGNGSIVDLNQQIDRLSRAGDPDGLRPVVDRFERIAEAHRSAVKRARDEWTIKRSAAIEATAEMAAALKSWQTDDVLMRWVKARIEELEPLVRRAEAAIDAENFDSPGRLLIQMREKIGELEQLANEAQLKADRRDYIVESMRNALEEMGYLVGPARPEHSNHPASAHLLHAKNASGRTIDVSVPVDGEIMFDAEGFPMDASRADGEVVRTCDEAELVLESLKTLVSSRGIMTTELMWDGKPPLRLEKSAKELPSSGDVAKKGSSG